MNEKRTQPKHVKLPSLNEPIRRRTVDTINFENKLLMQRLKTVSPVINRAKLEKEFEHHLKAEKNLRRRQMKPLALPKDLHATSPSKLRGSQTSHTDELFDASMYTAQRGNLLKGSNLDALDSQTNTNTLGIKSVSDFRREIIATKKLAHLTHTNPSSAHHSNRQNHSQSMAGLHIGEMQMSVDSSGPLRYTHSDSQLVHNTHNNGNNAFQNNSSNKRPAGDAIFEISHNPSATM